MVISPLPTPPSRQRPAQFSDEGDAFLGALPTFGSEANELANDVNAKSIQVTNSTVEAAGYASAAQTAAASMGAGKWNASTNYDEGDVVWSPLNGKSYRRKAPGGVVATDPSQDSTNWFDILAVGSIPSIPISTNTNATPNNRYIVESSGVTLTLPDNPSFGMRVGFTLLPNISDLEINPNSKPIRGVSGNMNVDISNASIDLTFIDDTLGWV